MRIALVHDFLVQNGGAEKVLEELHSIFPEAPIYTSIYEAEIMPKNYRHWDIQTSFLQKIPAKKRTHRFFLPWYPMAFESFDLSEYELVISSSSAFAHGVITHPEALHICYSHTPMRYAWMSSSYLERENMPASVRTLLAPTLHKLRGWDANASMRVDHYIANSRIVAGRIEKYYRRKCDIVFPPIDTEAFALAEDAEDYYLIAARFAPYKRLDLAIEACNKMRRKLVVVGSGRQEKHLRELAGPTVEFQGRVDFGTLVNIMSRCKAYIMPGQEDFGISPVEANACGRPVIAYDAGGARDSQREGVTGVLFEQQTVESLCEAIERLETMNFDPHRIREHAMQFDKEVFRESILRIVDEQWNKRKESKLHPPGEPAYIP